MGNAWRRRTLFACAAALLLAQAASVAQLLATAAYEGRLATVGLLYVDFDLLVYTVPPAAMLVAGFFLRCSLAQGKVSARSSAIFLATALLAVWSAREWLGGPMHDIALAWGSHGRWGCTTVDPDGSPVYLLTDSTLPWLLFGPSMLGVASTWASRFA